MYQGTTGNDLWPVTAVLSYMASIQRLPTTGCGLFFRFSNGQPLTRDSFVKKVQSALQSRGVEVTAYTGHSFQIRAAMTAAARGLPDSLIKTLGR